jgi:predicted HTH domain antitoxin
LFLAEKLRASTVVFPRGIDLSDLIQELEEGNWSSTAWTLYKAATIAGIRNDQFLTEVKRRIGW